MSDRTPAAPGSSPAGGSPRRRGHAIRNTILILLLAAFTAYVIHAFRAPRAGARGSPGAPGSFPVPVLAGAVMQKDVPLYLDGLGTVQALNTVTVRTRVDGELKKVAFVEGHDVKAGDLLAQIDDAPFNAQFQQAQAKKGQDMAFLANAKLDLERDADLIAKKVISPQQYETQKALVAQYEATVRADDAAIQSAKVQLDYTTVLSPLAGRTGVRLVDQGNVVHAGDARGLVVITQLQPISLIFTLPAQNLDEIRKQKAGGAELTVLAVDRDNKTVIDTGKLTVIDNQIDTTTGTILLKATFPNGELQLWPGQFINARLLLEVRKSGLVVPASVIQRGPNGPYAFVIKEDLGVEMRPVKVAQIEQGEALIDDGLRVGERVVVDGQYKLQPGSRVKISDGPSKGGPSKGGPPAGARGPRTTQK
ncbi:MAG: efflux RND transporter periplasmic adaptor subunit [Chthoniobacteraceae bacterium]